MRLAVLAVVLLLACRHESTYRGEGDVVSIEETRAVTLRHDDIAGLMPGMTMEFPVRAAAVLRGIAPGQRVRFELVREGDRLTVTRIEPIGQASGGGRPLHDHTPHHGGVVAMAGTIHVEMAAAADGRVRAYVTDLWRKPLAVDDVRSEVTLDLPEGPQTFPLVARENVLEASVPPLLGDLVRAHLRLLRGGTTTELHFLVPLRPGEAGAANLPPIGCVPPEARADAGAHRPRCVVAFPQPISALATTPDGTLAAAAVVNLGITVLRMPGAEIANGFAAPPPTEATSDEPPHGVTVNTIAVDARGSEALVGIERQLLRYAVESGRLLGEVPGVGGLVRAAAWTPDRTQALLTTFASPIARVVRVEDGTELRRFTVDGEAGPVAVSSDGRFALGLDSGAIVVIEVGSETAPRVVSASRRPVEAVGFAGPHLIAASADGGFRIFDTASGALVSGVDVGSPLLRLAIAPDGRTVASAGRDWKIRLHDPATGAVRETLAWHRAGVSGLAWAGPVLVSGDTEGWLAVWDVGQP